MRDGLIRIAREYPNALSSEPLKAHPLASFIRKEMPRRAADLIGAAATSYKIEGSAGQGNWADSPWLAFLDPVVTDSAMRGYYPVFLFGPKFETVVLMLGQGTYSVREEFKRDAPEILRARADILRHRVPEFSKWFERGPFPVRGSKKSAEDWELTSDTFGRQYKIRDMPTNEGLRADLERMLHCYHLVTSRGGFEVDGESDSSEGASGKDKKWQEGERRKRLHERLERRRNSALAREVKRRQGCQCKGCGFEFGTVYGTVGEKYIDAHHLVPLSRLVTDGPIPMDPVKDFAVLCANCHRMIHQMDCPPLDEFRGRISGRFLTLIARLKEHA